MTRTGLMLLACSVLPTRRALATTGGTRPAPPPPRVVALTAPDGTVFRATYFAAGRPARR